MLLHAHGDNPGSSVRSIDARAERGRYGLLHLAWRLDGDLEKLRVPAHAPAARAADGLWRHTCFEAFIAAAESDAYCELNFAPSGEWAAYHFTGYRDGMTRLEMGFPPEAQWRRTDAVLSLDVTLRTRDVLPRAGADHLRLALCAVVEEGSGTMSYWALRHPPGRPDFHHHEGFALELTGLTS